MATKKRNYQITAKLELQVDIEVFAASLEEALAQSNDLKVSDFVEFKGDYIDGGMRISAVYEV